MDRTELWNDGLLLCGKTVWLILKKIFYSQQRKTLWFLPLFTFYKIFVTSTVHAYIFFQVNFKVESLSSHLCCIVFWTPANLSAVYLPFKWTPVYYLHGLCTVVVDSDGCQTNQISYCLYWLPPTVENSIGGFQWYWWVAHPCHYAGRATRHDFPCFPCQRTFFFLSPRISQPFISEHLMALDYSLYWDPASPIVSCSLCCWDEEPYRTIVTGSGKGFI